MDNTQFNKLEERIKTLELKVAALEVLACSTPLPIIYTGASKPPKETDELQCRPCRPNPISFRRGV